MYTDFAKWTAGLLMAFVSVNSLAEVTRDLPRQVIGVSFGSVDTSGDYRFSGASSSAAAIDFASSPSYSLVWGIEDANARFAFEYYHAEAEIESPPFDVTGAPAELITQSLFYSGYWTPGIRWGIRGILGAGIGYSQHQLNNTTLTELEEQSWSLKASAGLQYGITRMLSVYGMAENIIHDDLEDRVTYPAVGDTPGGTAGRSISGNKQLRVAVGLNIRFD